MILDLLTIEIMLKNAIQTFIGWLTTSEAQRLRTKARAL